MTKSMLAVLLALSLLLNWWLDRRIEEYRAWNRELFDKWGQATAECVRRSTAR